MKKEIEERIDIPSFDTNCIATQINLIADKLARANMLLAQAMRPSRTKQGMVDLIAEADQLVGEAKRSLLGY